MTPFIEPDWPAPAGVIALSTRRVGGGSEWPYDTFNFALHVGDEPAAVEHNRQALLRALPGVQQIQWLEQVHADRVVEAGDATLPQADASTSCHRGLACAVLTADCLPLLLCDRAGTRVAAVHAGWRGLAGGVVQRALARFDCPPGDMLAWLGPAIGPDAFEVGPEVREAFLRSWGGDRGPEIGAAFSAGRGDRYFADLYRLAREALLGSGVTAIYGGEHCTYSEKESFFSHRRDGPTGRMVSLISLF